VVWSTFKNPCRSSFFARNSRSSPFEDDQSHGHWCNFLFCRRRRRRSKWSQVRIGKKSMHNSQSLRNEIFMLGDWSHQSRGQIHNQSSTAKEYSDAKRMLTRRRRRGWRRRRRRSGCYINLQKKYTQDCKKQTRTHPVLAFCPRIRVEEEEEEGFVVALSEDHVGRKIAAAKLQQKLLLLLWIANLMRRSSSCSPWYAGGSRWALRGDGLVHVIVVVVVSSDSCCCWQQRRTLLGSFFFILADLHKQQQQQLWMNALKVLVFHFPPPLLKLVFHDLFLRENRSFQQNGCVCVCVCVCLSLSLCADNEDYPQLAQFSVLALVLHHTYAVHVKCWIP